MHTNRGGTGVGYEELYEAFLDLERVRRREAESRQVAEILLAGLHDLTAATTAQDGLDSVLRTLRDTGGFAAVFVLVEEAHNVFKALSSTKAVFEGTFWRTGTVFERLLERMKPLILSEPGKVPEWRGQSAAVLEEAGAAVHAPFAFGRVRAILTCVRHQRGACATADAKLLAQLMPLLEQTLLTMRRMDELRVAKAALHAKSCALETTVQENQLMARTDYLTELPNRRAFFEAGAKEIRRAERYARPLSLLLMDLDHFKQINDVHGHDIGDQVLIQLGQLCRVRLREHDVLARLGGEEFAVLLPETELYEARQVAEELRKEIASAQLVTCLASGQVTMSLGVCELAAQETALAEMLKRADRALYSAKQGGRNLVCSE
ncbi:MAG: GGDEF domain-containing protein [Desulfohalobium sp.]